MTRRRGDDGAYLVLYALLATALFTMAAIVLDLAALRQGRRADRAAADLAATAGATALDPIDPSTFAAACQAAWDYVLLNEEDAPTTATPSPCGSTFAAVPCDPSVAATATGTLGRITISVTYPVPDASELMQAEVQGGDRPQAVVPAADGLACQRIAVRIERRRPFLFGGLAGTDEGRTDVHAVARASVQPGPVVPGIVSLETTGCDGVSVTPDGGELEVDPVAGGLVLVDSDASSCGAGATIAAPVPSALDAGAGGTIGSFALAGPFFGSAWSGDVVPAPSPALRRTGRGILDIRYNCGPPCGEAQGKLDALRFTLNGSAPALQYSGTIPGSCTVVFGDVAVVPADVHVPCPAGLLVAGSLTLRGATNVLDGGVTVLPGACFAVNDVACGGPGGPPRDAILFLRSGDLVTSPASTLSLRRTFVHLPGVATVPAGDPLLPSRVAWTAPEGGDFEDLLAWSDAAGTTTLGEQGATQYEGTLAMPNGVVALEGRPAGSTVQALQVVARRVRLQGSGTYRLSPSALRATGLVARQVKLIR